MHIQGFTNIVGIMLFLKDLRDPCHFRHTQIERSYFFIFMLLDFRIKIIELVIIRIKK